MVLTATTAAQQYPVLDGWGALSPKGVQLRRAPEAKPKGIIDPDGVIKDKEARAAPLSSTHLSSTHLSSTHLISAQFISAQLILPNLIAAQLRSPGTSSIETWLSREPKCC